MHWLLPIVLSGATGLIGQAEQQVTLRYWKQTAPRPQLESELEISGD